MPHRFTTICLSPRALSQCEEGHGVEEVEALLDAAHALKDQGVFRCGRSAQPTSKEGEAIQRLPDQYATQKNVLGLWSDRHLATPEMPEKPTGIEASERQKNM